MAEATPAHLSDESCPHFTGLDPRTRQHIARAAERAAAKAGTPSRALIESLRVVLTESPVTAERSAA